MTQRIAIVSQKGGVGKTTVSLNLALALAERRRRTLLVDLDPQGGLGHALARPDESLGGIADLLMGRATPEQAVLRTKLETLSLLPRGRFSPIDTTEFEEALASPGVLSGVLGQVESSFDIVLIDTPSGLGRITRAALAAADHVLLPVQGEPMALRAIGQTLEVVDHVRTSDNPRLQLLGILPTMVQKGFDPSMAVLVELWNGFGAVLETAIPRAEVFANASQSGLPVAYLGGPPSPEVRRFELLATEVEQALIKTKGMEADRAVQPQRELI